MTMNPRDTDKLDYGGTRVRDDLRGAHRFLLDHVRTPGTWWTGSERVAIAAASRAAARCGLCRARRGSLSPAGGVGRHDGSGALPEDVTDTVHPAPIPRGSHGAGSTG